MSNVLPDIHAELAALRAENARLKAGNAPRIKISDKGCVSVYGMGRFPVSLYRSQWIKLFEQADHIKGFIASNADALDAFDEDK
jgi:hypothetical protein